MTKTTDNGEFLMNVGIAIFFLIMQGCLFLTSYASPDYNPAIEARENYSVHMIAGVLFGLSQVATAWYFRKASPNGLTLALSFAGFALCAIWVLSYLGILQ